MLTLYEGGFTSLVHDEIIKKIIGSVKVGKRTFLFVPEQQTLTIEAQTCSSSLLRLSTKRPSTRTSICSSNALCAGFSINCSNRYPV